MSGTYREHFEEAGKAAAYDAAQYSAGSYGEIVWQIERAQLSAIVEQFRATHPRIDYLDFAAGTGRIISFLEDKVDSATGIEISESMLAVARTKASKSTLICADITAPAAAIEAKYDLITAFRFVLNAEPTLRLLGLKALAARLRDDSSRLIFNNHGNLWSIKLLLWPWHKFRTLGKGRQQEGNYLTHREVKRMVRAAGLEIESVRGAGFISEKAMRLMSPARVSRLEHRLSSSPILAPFAVNQMYVVRRARK